MNSSFRASKLILSKLGTAASFGFGLNAGVRYSDSQSSHRLHGEEAPLAVSRARVDLTPALQFVEGGEGSGGACIDVDRSELLQGYSCFTPSASSSSSPPSVSSVSSSSSSSPSSSSSRPEQKEVSAHSTESVPPHHNPHVDFPRPLRQEASPDCLITSRSVLQVQPHCVDSVCSLHQQQNLLKKQPEQWKQPELKLMPQQDYMEDITWRSLVDRDQCSLCCDLLAVPVVTPCQHCFCGSCFLDMQQAFRQVFPMDCPNCRRPLQQGDARRDVARDGRIAHQVGLFVEAKKAGSVEEGGEEWRAQYSDWLQRRERVSMATAIAAAQEEEQGEQEEVEVVPWLLGDSEPGSGSSIGGGAVVLLGVLTVACLVLLAPGRMQQSRPPPGSFLRSLASALCFR